MLTTNISQTWLFPEMEREKIERLRLQKQQQKHFAKQRGLIHPCLTGIDFPVEGKYDMPMVRAYSGMLPNHFIQFTDASRMMDGRAGIHFFQNDALFNRVWTNPERYVPRFRTFSCLIGMDFSVFIDGDKPVNIWNIYRNRILSCYFQHQNCNVIPSFSFGAADTLDFCCDGIPEDSVVCIGNVAVGRDSDFRQLLRLATMTLVKKKRPRLLLVYGNPLDFEPGVEVKVIESRIQKLRKL